MNGKTNAASDLDLFAIIIELPSCDRLRAIFVGNCSGGGEDVIGGIIEFFIISPVWATWVC